MISLILAASIVVIIDPPAAPLACELPGVRVVLANGTVIHAARANYLPSALGIVVVPVAPGRIHCSGFERPAP